MSLSVPSPRQGMILDACVLIDFIKADRVILASISKHLGSLHVIQEVLEEVHEIHHIEEILELGIKVIEPELEDVFTAAQKRGPLSFQDWLCLLTAKRHGLTCVTNDKSLRKICQQEEIPLRWGLELLVELYRCGGTTRKDALEVARKIHKNNPKHITVRLLRRFERMILRKI